MRARTGCSEYRPGCYEGQRWSNRSCKDKRNVCKVVCLLINERPMTFLLLPQPQIRRRAFIPMKMMKQESAEREKNPSLPPKQTRPPAHLRSRIVDGLPPPSSSVWELAKQKARSLPVATLPFTLPTTTRLSINLRRFSQPRRGGWGEGATHNNVHRGGGNHSHTQIGPP